MCTSALTDHYSTILSLTLLWKYDIINHVLIFAWLFRSLFLHMQIYRERRIFASGVYTGEYIH